MSIISVPGALASVGATGPTGPAGPTVFVTPQMFGAVGDGVADDTAAIQAAIDANKGATTARRIYFPAGIYKITAPISVWTSTILYGDGQASILKASGVFSSILKTVGTLVGSAVHIEIDTLSFEATGATWAIQSSTGTLANSRFTNLFFNCVYCMDLSAGYTQFCYLFNLSTYSPVEQILRLNGNFNRIESIDKEGATGTSTEPYIHVTGNPGFVAGNSFKKILLEGTGSVNKTPIEFVNASTNTVEDLWIELATNGYAVKCEASTVRFSGTMRVPVVSQGKIQATNHSHIRIDRFNAQAEDIDWQPFFEPDTTSLIEIETLISRRAADPYKLAGARNLIVKRIVNQTLLDSAVHAYNIDVLPDHTSGQNLLINPSFEAGFYGWTVSSGVPVITYVPSDFGPGLMMSISTAVGFSMRQNVTVTPTMVGRPLTMRYCINVAGGTGVKVVPIICSDTGGAASNIVRQDTGHQTVSVTFTPTTSGSFTFGINLNAITSGTTVITLDDFCLAPGTAALLNPAKFGSYELNGKTVANAAAVPTTGTWKAGDYVRNSAPAAGAPTGWYCTVAGTPGTWVVEGPQVITPQMFGAVGNGIADDTVAFQTAVNAGVPLTLPAGSIYKFADREGVRLSSNTYIKGAGGKIVCAGAAGGPWRAFTVGFPYITTNVDYSNIVIDGVEFESSVDEQFSHFIMLTNPGGDLADVWIKNCKFKYTGGHTASGDRWAISLGGRPADARTNIHIEGNYCEGRMQLTGNGQDANWTDLYIDDNVVRGSQIAGIALSRLSNATGNITTYTRIRARRNDIYSATNGTIGIFFGADSSSISDDPQVWSDVEISDNTIDLGGASAIDILFRSGQGALSSVAALRILKNNCKSIINASLALARHTGTVPASFEAVVVDNVFRKDVSITVGNSVLQGNHIRGQILPSSDAIVRLLHNQINNLRMEAASVVRSEYNVYRALNGQRAINMETAAGTVDLISANDAFEYGDTTGAATSAIRVAGAAGTVVCVVKDMIDNYGLWSAGAISQNNGKTVTLISGDGGFIVNDFPGADIGAKFNAAVAAVRSARNVTTGWLSDIAPLVIKPGTYDLTTTMDINSANGLCVDAYGVTIRNLTGAYRALNLVSSHLVTIRGMKFDFRNNNVAPEAIRIAGSCNWLTFTDCGVQGNSSLATFAAVRMLQGDAAGGIDDNDRNKGNFWATFERFWTRKLSGGDANEIPIAIDAQGCQNALKISNCKFGNCTIGVLVQNQNGSTLSDISNDVQILGTTFEGCSSHAVKYLTTDSTAAIAGGAIMNCRSEVVGIFAEAIGFGTVQQPVMMMGNTIVSSTSTYLGASGQTNFNVLDGSITPPVSAKLNTDGGLQLQAPSGNGKPPLRIVPKQIADGGSIILERTDGTVDGRIGQRSGGGMEIEGGAAASLRFKNVKSISGSTTFGANLRGTSANPASGTTIAVTLSPAEPDATYFVVVGGDTDRDYWVTSRATGGFTINTDTAFAGTGNTWWILIR